MKEPSYTTRCLWAKKSRDGGTGWLPLVVHLGDCAALSTLVWRSWVPKGVKELLAARSRCGEDAIEKLLIFICAAHDIGKATPVFASKTSAFPPGDLDEMLMEKMIAAGFPIKAHRDFSHPKRSPHALASQLILEDAGCCQNVAAITGAHHGKPPSMEDLVNNRMESCEENFFLNRCGEAAWRSAWKELIAFALALSGFDAFEEMPQPDMPSQALLSGLLVMIDWLASNERYFPYIDVNAPIQLDVSEARAKTAFAALDFLKTGWRASSDCLHADLFEKRFGFSPRKMQDEAVSVAQAIGSPGLLILEAPMGAGKTEVALAIAEIFAYKTGRAGVYFALPTQATSDGIFPRMLQWINALEDGTHSIELIHSKAQFNDQFQALRHIEGSSNIWENDGDAAAVFSWFEGAKKSILADFAVGTIDQLLMAALRQKHLMLRHLGLAGKVVIIDECHAYDAYMDKYLEMALRWLGAYHVPVIMLSATLPAQKRKKMAEAYLNKTASKALEWDAPDTEAYPLLTYTANQRLHSVELEMEVSPQTVEITELADDDIADILETLLADGGCAGIIVNSVKRAQTFAQMLQARFGEETVQLLHAQFITPDRIKKETQLRSELGKPGFGTQRPSRRIVVGTQVIEQSLDLDFDLLITDLCPMDLLLQRIGRLHRHDRARPPKLLQPRCFVLGMNQENSFESASSFIYGNYILMRTKAFLPEKIVLPNDICHLVQLVYNDYNDNEKSLEAIQNSYNEAKSEWENRIAIKERKATSFRICKPWEDADETIIGWLDTVVPVTDAAGEAAVRDSQDSLEVIALKRSTDGKLIGFNTGIALDAKTPDNRTAREIAKDCLRLPAGICYRLAAVIEELERRNSEELPLWRKSPWLCDSLILIFDSFGEASLCGYKLKYDAFYGLTYTKEDGADD
ncbi:MAG: CRISPR-associated helicase Cas3' [Clostridia bacterium]|nr:CRISPR-associated helicase Cas3' [Clostridia bacterium]